MSLDTDRLVTLAGELKDLDARRQNLLAELARIAQGIGGGGTVAPRRGRPPGRPAQRKASGPTPSGKRRKGLTNDIIDFLKKGGGAYTAGEILSGLSLPKSASRVSTISTTLVRLAKEGRAKKDKERGYRAA